MSLKRKMIDFMMPKEFLEIAGLMHSCVFSLQKSVTELLGKAALRDFIIPRVIESVSRVSGFEETLKESNNIEEVFDKFAKLLKKLLSLRM